MRKLLFAVTLFALFATAFTMFQPALVQAKDPLTDACTGQAANSPTCKAKNTTANPLTGDNGVLTQVVNVLGFVGGIMVTIVILIGGFKYITSDGDSGKVSSAKNTIIYGLIGLVVIILARVIVGFVIGNIG